MFLTGQQGNTELQKNLLRLRLLEKSVRALGMEPDHVLRAAGRPNQLEKQIHWRPCGRSFAQRCRGALKSKN